MRPGRQRQTYERSWQDASAKRRGSNEMRDGTGGAPIHRQTTTHVADHRYVVIPVHGIAQLRLGWAAPMVQSVGCAVLDKRVSDVGSVEHCGRCASDESVLGHESVS